MTVFEDVRALRKEVEAATTTVERHEEQINGKRGLSAAIDTLTAEVRGLRKAAYWLAGLIVASSVGFAFSVLTVFGGP